MSKIKLLLLEGCSKCQKLKEALGKNYIHYEYEICKSDTIICDSIEDLTGCSNYPVVLKIINKSFIEEVAYITDKYEDVGKTLQLNNRVRGKAFYSIDKLIEYVINL
jgi:arsenate reductase-like glutaredoxin family protein